MGSYWNLLPKWPIAFFERCFSNHSPGRFSQHMHISSYVGDVQPCFPSISMHYRCSHVGVCVCVRVWARLQVRTKTNIECLITRCLLIARISDWQLLRVSPNLSVEIHCQTAVRQKQWWPNTSEIHSNHRLLHLMLNAFRLANTPCFIPMLSHKTLKLLRSSDLWYM